MLDGRWMGAHRMIWLIIHTPDGVFVWPVWEDDAEPDASLIDAARVLVGYPADDIPVRTDTDTDGYDIQLAPGEPHASLLARATVGSVADLRKVDATAVATHVQARVAAARQSTVDAAKAVLANLDDDTLKAVLADPAVAQRATVAPVRSTTKGA